MDLRRFLSGGTTYAHAPKNSALAKVGAALVMTLAMCAEAQAESRAAQVTQMVPPSDLVSAFYQNLASPDSNKLLVVSSVSTDLSRILATMPASFAKQLQSTGGQDKGQDSSAAFIRAISSDPDHVFSYRLTGSTLFGGKQTLCFTSAAEAIQNQTKYTPEGITFIPIKASGSMESIHNPGEAMFFTTSHELYHCAASNLFASAAQQQFGDAGKAYGLAVDEMLADLAAVLNYASQDGNFANGLASIKGMRAAGLADIEHNTEDMLDYVVSHLDPDQVKGMSSGNIMKMVNSIGHELDPMQNQDLKNLFAVSAAEKVSLSQRLYGENVELSSAVADTAKVLGVDLSAANPDARAMKVIDATVTLNVKNSALHRQLDSKGVSDMTKLAEDFGVTLPVYQQMRAATFDTTVSKTNVSSPWPSDSLLKAGDRITPLFNAHLASMEAQKAAKSGMTMQ